MTTIQQAYDIIGAIVKAAWEGDAASVAQPLLWDDVEADKPGEDTNGRPETWARATIRHIEGGDVSFAAPANRRYDSSGVVTVQIFVPGGVGGPLARQLAENFKRAFRSASNPKQVWFRDVAAVEVGADGPWFNLNVTAAFTYEARG